jgi:hypothetical protein
MVRELDQLEMSVVDPAQTAILNIAIVRERVVGIGATGSGAGRRS